MRNKNNKQSILLGGVIFILLLGMINVFPTFSNSNLSIDSGLFKKIDLDNGNHRLYDLNPKSSFIRNRDQFDIEICSYYYQRDGLLVLLGPKGIILTNEIAVDADSIPLAMRVSINFIEANEISPQGTVIQKYISNYLIGRDTSKWIIGDQHYGEVVYHNLWNNVDLVYRIVDARLKYELLVHPGGTPDDIRFAYSSEDVLGISIRAGELVIDAPSGGIHDGKPLAYQESDGLQFDIECQYQMVDPTVVGFYVGPYNSSKLLTIDPVINFFTYLGGNDWDEVGGIGVDNEGNVIIAGHTRSTDYPILGGLENNFHHGWYDITVTKLNKNGTRPIFSTFIGGLSDDLCHDMAIDSFGNIVLCGETRSSDFPVTSGAYCMTKKTGAASGFILKLSPDGANIRFSTFIQGGTGGMDYVTAISIDSYDRIYAVGYTTCDDFPVTQSAHDISYNGGGDVFVLKLNETGDLLLYSTYVGGLKLDEVKDCSVDFNGTLYCTGTTDSSDFPTTEGVFNRQYMGGEDIFIFALNATGMNLIFSTLLGGGDIDEGSAITLDNDGAIYITGTSGSANYPVSSDTIESVLNGRCDAILTKLDYNGSTLLFSTFLGGSDRENGNGIQISNDGFIYIVGVTNSIDLPISYPSFNPKANGDWDLFAMKINTSSSKIISSTYLGGSNIEYNPVIALMDDTTIVLAGNTQSKDFPTTVGSFRFSFCGGPSDLIVCKLQLGFLLGSVPSAPMNVTASSLERRVDISWTIPDVDGGLPVFGYFLYRGDESDNLSLLLFFNRTVFNYSDTSIRPGTKYYYAISAINALGEGPRSGPVSAIPWGQPTPPSMVNLIAGCRTVILSWSVPNDIGDLPLSGYRIYRGDSPLSMDLLYEIGPLVIEYRDENLENGKEYFYSICAFNARGNGANSTVIIAVPTGPPDAPENFLGTPGDKKMKLIWHLPLSDGGKPILGYVLYRGLSLGAQSELVVLGIVQDYLDENLTNNWTYYYSVRAFNSIGRGGMSVSIAVRPVGIPDTPESFKAEGKDGFIDLLWKSPINDGGFPITGYLIYRGMYSSYLSVIARVGPVNSYIDSDVLNGETFFYQVRAFNIAGSSPPTQTLIATAMGVPGSPLNLTATINDGGIFLRWSAPINWGGAPSLSYLVLRGASPDSIHQIAIVETSQEYSDSDVVIGETYYFGIVAVNEAGHGPISSAAVVVMGGPPGSPKNVTVQPRDSYVILSWSPGVTDYHYPITGYIVLRGLFEQGLMEIAHINDSTVYNDTDVRNDIKYFYAIIAVNSIGIGPQSDIVTAIPGDVSNIPKDFKFIILGTDVILSWATPSIHDPTVTGYIIYRGEDPKTQRILTTTGNLQEYKDGSALLGRRYYYSIRAFNEFGFSDVSATLEVNTENKAASISTIIISIILLIMLTLTVFFSMRLNRNTRNR